MADYKKMYTTLFNKITDVVTELQKVQRDTEEMYIKGSEPEIKVIKKDEIKDI